MSENIIGILILVVVVLVFAGLMLNSYIRQKRYEATFPGFWIQSGEAPPRSDEALYIINTFTPGMRHYGYIEWVKEPYYLAPGLRVAGSVDSDYPPRIRVVAFPNVWETALAHEIGHVWSFQTNQGFGESPSDFRFVNWFNNVNAVLKKDLGSS